ncbi:vacuolar protein sorting-associated protein 45 [Kluyveromyces marxianus]|uniref:Vacuolar protein sorting-associated protein 45 n=1 Tax=Kluyveromyces marxianus TaxID=4911 RepID=A0ABX6F1L4_KLUMA|nr:vacuolar protein sorting-associated protein 45 [Kluyveromyces marxianus]
MNLFQVGDFYIDRLANFQGRTSDISIQEKSRVKALLLDNDTISTISMCTTQTELLKHEIYLVDKLGNFNRDPMPHLKCLCYLKPTEETISNLLRELQDPKYGEYQIFFNNQVSKSQLERLAERDDMEVVTHIEEVFQDYLIVNKDVFTLELPLYNLLENQLLWNPKGLQETSSGLLSLLLSLKLNPTIAYDSQSKICHKLAKDLEYEIKTNERQLFDFPVRDSNPLLIVLDRKSDPLTPLLQPWTYQSMINEYIGIKRNLVDLSAVPNIDPELKQVVLSPKQDKFFQETMYMNFGDLADKVKNYVDQYKAKANITKQINTIEDIKAFIEKYPEFKKLSGNISKHMAIVSELDRQLQVKNIWEVSELEQNLATHDDNNHDFNELKRLLGLTTVESYFKLKLCCIFVLRHGSNGGRVKEIENILRQQCDPAQVALYFQFKNRFKSSFKVRADPQDNDLISGLTKKFNKLGSSGAENVFMQHVPELTRILSDLDKNKFPQSSIKLLNERIDTKTYIPQDVVIFIVGGLTIEESRAVHQFNEKYRKGKDNCRIIIGGTSILTTEQFLTDVSAINDKPEDLL